MGLTRTPHWATAELHAFLLQRADAPFAWGKNDCCLFPADAILAFTGVDIARDFRGKYRSAAGAMRAITKVAGGRTVGDAVAWCAEQHGLEELAHPRCAQRGDLVTMLNGDGVEMAGIVGLSGRHLITVGQVGRPEPFGPEELMQKIVVAALVGATEPVAREGLVTFSIERVKRAWRV